MKLPVVMTLRSPSPCNVGRVSINQGEEEGVAGAALWSVSVVSGLPRQVEMV